jgi:hypothetical protein
LNATATDIDVPKWEEAEVDMFAAPIEQEFPWPNDDKRYRLFSDELENSCRT